MAPKIYGETIYRETDNDGTLFSKLKKGSRYWFFCSSCGSTFEKYLKNWINNPSCPHCRAKGKKEEAFRNNLTEIPGSLKPFLDHLDKGGNKSIDEATMDSILEIRCPDCGTYSLRTFETISKIMGGEYGENSSPCGRCNPIPKINSGILLSKNNPDFVDRCLDPISETVREATTENFLILFDCGHKDSVRPITAITDFTKCLTCRKISNGSKIVEAVMFGPFPEGTEIKKQTGSSFSVFSFPNGGPTFTQTVCPSCGKGKRTLEWALTLPDPYCDSCRGVNRSLSVKPLKNPLIVSQLGRFAENLELVHQEEGLISTGSAQLIEIKCSDCNMVQKCYPYVLFRGSGTISCPNCMKINHRSNGEADLLKLVGDNYKGEVRSNFRGLIAPQEVDIYLPDFNLAFEYNGEYWHREEAIGRIYHFEKFKKCQEIGVQLIQIWDSEWKHPVIGQAIRKSIVHKIGASKEQRVSARSLKVVTNPSLDQVRKLLDNNHVQGYVPYTYGYGLQDKASGGLVAFMGYSVDSRRPYEVTLNRYVTSKVVRGGFQKLLKHSADDLSKMGYQKMVSFSDNMVSDGGLYGASGFVIEKELEPDYSYFHKKRLHHKSNFRKKRFKEDPELLYRDAVTEKELAEMNSLYRVWDAGKVKWVLDI